MDKFKAVEKMLQMKDPPLFVVMLRPGSGHQIAGQGQEKLHLTVSARHTSFIRQTQDGFECAALFPSDMTEHPGIWDPELSNGLVETRLNVRLQSIVRIDGVTKEGQGDLVTLYEEPLIMDERARWQAVFARTASLLWL